MINGESIRIDDREERVIIFLPPRALTRQSTRQLVPSPESADLKGRNVGIELRPLRFVRPFGLIYLYWYIRWLLDEQGARRVDVVLDGSNRDLCNYIKRMKLPAVFGDAPVTIYPIQNLQLEKSDLTDSLVELTSFRVDDDNEVERRTQDTLRVILTQRPDLQSQADKLAFTIAELLSNIHVHSQTREAALAVQTYSDAVELAFGDGGIGIAGALQPHVDGPLPDADYVRKALEPGVSSRIGGGGYGLTQLRETVEEEDGRLVIRSGSGQVTVESGSEDARNDCSPLPGTLVEVTFPT